MRPPAASLALRRVVVTGVGIASPLAVGREATWRGILSGESGLREVRGEAEAAWAQLPRTVGQVVEAVPGGSAVSRFVGLGLVAAREAVDDAGEGALDEAERCGASIASGVGALEEATRNYEALRESPRRVSPFFVPRLLANMATGAVSMAHSLRGPSSAPATACAAGAQAIGDAFRAVQRGDADLVLAGGAEAAVSPLAVAGFARAKALARDGVARPFDVDRSGFVLAEGAAVLVLEALDRARARRAPRIYAELRGYGATSDAHHVTSPRPDGAAATAAMRRALRNSGVDTVHYLNAHAAGTPLGDKAEAIAVVNAALGPDCFVSSTKAATGHLLGAAGALEAALVVLALRDRLAPHTLHLAHPAPEALPLRLVTGQPAPLPADAPLAALSNSFGFGGVNASLLFTSPPP